jgi:hypothetical protein
MIRWQLTARLDYVTRLGVLSASFANSGNTRSTGPFVGFFCKRVAVAHWPIKV